MKEGLDRRNSIVIFQATAEEMRTAGLLEPQKGQLLNLLNSF